MCNNFNFGMRDLQFMMQATLFESPIPAVLTHEYIKRVFVEAYAARKQDKMTEKMRTVSLLLLLVTVLF